jgi:hypothetical protein
VLDDLNVVLSIERAEQLLARIDADAEATLVRLGWPTDPADADGFDRARAEAGAAWNDYGILAQPDRPAAQALRAYLARIYVVQVRGAVIDGDAGSAAYHALQLGPYVGRILEYAESGERANEHRRSGGRLAAKTRLPLWRRIHAENDRLKRTRPELSKASRAEIVQKIVGCKTPTVSTIRQRIK